MKTIFTLFLISNMFLTSTAQLVLNELYTSPGAGKHEFFELYNTSASSSPVSLAGYSIISYFEESAGVKGFYVLDLPDLQIAPKAYLVGSSATTFNYQGVTGSTSTHFSWNDLAFLNLNNGYLKKWVAGNNVPVGIDGNAEYDEQVLPADFNDFLNRIPGGGASYGVFIYKDGELVNAFLGGESGHSVPAFISSMPVLNADFVGVGNYGINFANINSAVAEYVISDAGSDNGFIRNKDGLCGAWQKSSSSAQHTPNVANGVLSGEVSSAVSLWATITKGYNTTDSATLSYKILSAPDGILPVIFDIYVDNGTPGVIDGFDTYIASREINDLTDTLFTQLFLPYNANIIIGVRTLAGCYNSISLTPNIGFLLPIKMLHFNGLIDNRTVRLQWSVTDNNAESRFEVQKSEDGIAFKTTGIVFSSDKVGSEQYSFKEITENEPGGYYRIKTYHADHSVTYSKVIRLISQETTVKRNIRLINNPVDSYLGFTFEAVTNMPSEISIYNMSGAKIYSTQVATHKGSNMVTLAMGGRIYTGVYVLEVRNGQQKTAVKIIKK